MRALWHLLYTIQKESVRKMKAKLQLSVSVEAIVKKMRESLIKDGFIFAENDKSYVVQYTDKGMKKIQSWSKFWSRKHLGDPYPIDYSLVIQGEIKQEEKASIIEVELVEYHANREHGYGGTDVIDQYFDKFCEIFSAKPK